MLLCNILFGEDVFLDRNLKQHMVSASGLWWVSLWQWALLSFTLNFIPLFLIFYFSLRLSIFICPLAVWNCGIVMKVVCVVFWRMWANVGGRQGEIRHLLLRCALIRVCVMRWKTHLLPDTGTKRPPHSQDWS